jgi:hypothetical protein
MYYTEIIVSLRTFIEEVPIRHNQFLVAEFSLLIMSAHLGLVQCEVSGRRAQDRRTHFSTLLIFRDAKEANSLEAIRVRLFLTNKSGVLIGI